MERQIYSGQTKTSFNTFVARSLSGKRLNVDKHAHIARLTLLVVPPSRGRGLGSNSKEYDTTEQNTISVYTYESGTDSREFS